MAEKPILFSTPMVQAILDGRKKMTRRVVKPQPDHRHRDIVFEYGKLNEYSQIAGVWNVVEQRKPPYQPGDLLWVKETWCENQNPNSDNCGGYEYKADYEGAMCSDLITWKSSRFMPKAAARIWLEVTSVRVERLQEITDEDAKAEGVMPHGDNANPHIKTFYSLWQRLNAKRGYDWDKNPFCWVIEFRRVRHDR